VQRVEILVLGGGVAGAAVAFHLGRLGLGPRVMLLERHPAPGRHASGRNARLVLQSVAEPSIRSLVAASAREYARQGAAIGFDRCGSLLVGRRDGLATRRDPGLVDSRLVDAAAARRRVPLLRTHPFEAALETPGDGVLDPHRLLAWYLGSARRNGVKIRLGIAATGVTGGGPLRVDTSAGPCEADRVVDATGAWAGGLGGEPRPFLAPRKRHLFLLDHRLDDATPFVWDVDRDLYFRADADGTVACMCDEIATESLDETVENGVEDLLRQKLAEGLGPLAAAPLLRSWACFRTHTFDGLPLLGPSPGDAALWWVAGLGGHGLSSSWEIGRLVAEALASGAEALPPALRARRATTPASPAMAGARPAAL
jgi:glycine/D-amino acid oxidase-like deaminating enzyme